MKKYVRYDNNIVIGLSRSHMLYWTGQKQALCACTCHVLNMCMQRGMTPRASGACGLLTMTYMELHKNYAAAMVSLYLIMY